MKKKHVILIAALFLGVVIILVAGYFVGEAPIPAPPDEQSELTSRPESEPPALTAEETAEFKELYLQFAVAHQLPSPFRPVAPREEIFYWRYEETDPNGALLFKQKKIRGVRFDAENFDPLFLRPFSFFFGNNGFVPAPYYVPDQDSFQLQAYRRDNTVCIIMENVEGYSPFAFGEDFTTYTKPRSISMMCGTAHSSVAAEIPADPDFFGAIPSLMGIVGEQAGGFAEASVGRDFDIALPADPARLYSWAVYFDPRLFALSGRREDPPVTGDTDFFAEGAETAQKEIFTFSPRMEGETDIVFLYRMLGDGTRLAAQQARYTVTVRR